MNALLASPRSLWLLPALLVLCGCVSEQVRTVNGTRALQAKEEIPESLLMDVGIQVFDPGLPEDDAELEKKGIYPAVRKAESRFIPYTLKGTMARTAQWGSIWVVPKPTNAVDLLVQGRILESDGEVLEIQVTALDATGRQWFDKRYEGAASKYSYDDELKLQMDPFQDIYNTIANDLVAARSKLSDKEIRNIRSVAELRYATDFSEEAFNEHLEKSRDGTFQIARLPADDDPMMNRMHRIREREYTLYDVLDEHYGNFHQNMDGPYEDWRKYSYEEAIALRQVEAEARNRKLLGAAAIIGGILAARNATSSATSAASTAAVIGGIAALKSGFDRGAEAKIHKQALEELAGSLEAEVRPMVVDVEGTTVELTGSAEAQYDEWRRLLREIYESESATPLGAGVNGAADPP